MQLKPGMEAEYEKRHNPIWEELAEVLRENGVSNYSIFLHPGTYQLFAYAEIEDEDRWQAIASSAVCRRNLRKRKCWLNEWKRRGTRQHRSH